MATLSPLSPLGLFLCPPSPLVIILTQLQCSSSITDLFWSAAFLSVPQSRCLSHSAAVNTLLSLDNQTSSTIGVAKGLIVSR